MSDAYKIFEENPLAWGFYYFPHHFRDKSPQFHYKILVESMKNQLFAVAAPRGSAKSTVLTFLKTAHKIAFKKTHFTVICQNTFNKAASSLETIKDEWKTNKRLSEDFPIDFSKRDRVGDTIFEHPDGHMLKVLCKGWEQIGSVRGEKFGAYRPDYILIDDLEDDVMVRSRDQRENLRDVYDKALVKAVDPKNFEIDCIGTILHDDCLIARLVSNKHYLDYRKLLYRAKTKNKEGEWESLWPERWTIEELNRQEKNDPTTFAQEMQNDPVSGVLSNFQKEDFRYWWRDQDNYVLLESDGRVISKGALRHCKAAIGTDLAWEEKKSSDSTVILAAFVTPNADIMIDKFVEKKGMKPDEFEAYIFPMVERLSAITGKDVPIGFEKSAYEKGVKWHLKQAMRRRNKFLTLKDFPWPQDKISRIVTTLQPRYKQNALYHQKGMGDLEYQLLRIPHGTHDDIVDALRIAVLLLEYAPAKPKDDVEVEDEGFDWLRTNFCNPKKEKKEYFFGQKVKKGFEVPHTKSWR